MGDEEIIKKVQASEHKAKESIEEAKRERAEKLQKANDKARKIIEDAENKAKELRESSQKELEHMLEEIRKKRLENAKNTAARIRKTNVTKSKIEEVARTALKRILG